MILQSIFHFVHLIFESYSSCFAKYLCTFTTAYNVCAQFGEMLCEFMRMRVFFLHRQRIQTCGCPCRNATRAATPSSRWPKTTRTSSCPQTCSCQGRIKELRHLNPQSLAGGTSPTRSELKLTMSSLLAVHKK